MRCRTLKPIRSDLLLFMSDMPFQSRQSCYLALLQQTSFCKVRLNLVQVPCIGHMGVSGMLGRTSTCCSKLYLGCSYTS